MISEGTLSLFIAGFVVLAVDGAINLRLSVFLYGLGGAIINIGVLLMMKGVR